MYPVQPKITENICIYISSYFLILQDISIRTLIIVVGLLT